MVGLHTCGDLAPSTLRMFVAKPELAAVCSVGCCYHLLSEEFDPAGQGNHTGFFFFYENIWFLLYTDFTVLLSVSASLLLFHSHTHPIILPQTPAAVT